MLTENEIQKKSQSYMKAQASAMLAIVIAAIVDHYWVTQFPFTASLVAIGALLTLSGAVLLMISLRKLGPSLTPEPIPKLGGILVTSGIYSFCRHPIYLAILLASAGWVIAFSSAIGVAIFGILFISLLEKAKFEENLLLKKFGTAYKEYCVRVGRFLP